MVSVEDNIKNIMSKFMKMQDKQERTGTLWKVGEIGQTLDFGLNKYQVLYELGKGAQGKVFCVERVETRQHFAMKVCKPSSSALSEIKIQRSCYCPNIVTIVESQKINNKVYMILELGETNLEKYLETKKDKGLEQQELFQLISNIIGGLAVIHRNNFIHHDLKLSNIILNMDIFKIADFGISTKGDFQPMLGTPTYFAPQILKMATQTRTPPSAVDIWALGVLVFEACFDMHPFLARSFSDINNLKSQISILCQNGYSFAAYKQLLRRDGNVRKLMKFQEKQKRLINRDILQYFFNRAFTFEPVNRLTLQQIYLMLQQVRPVNQNMNVNLFLSHAATSSSINPSISQNSIPAFNNTFSFQPQSSMVSLNSVPSIVVPLQLTNNTNTNYDKTSIIQFLQKTIQILKLTFKDHLTQLVLANQSITSLIHHHQGLSPYDPQIKLSILGIYQRMNTLIPSMPGVFTRLLISAYLYQILHSFPKFITQIKSISKSPITTLSFKQLNDFSASIDYNSFLVFIQIVNNLN